MKKEKRVSDLLESLSYAQKQAVEDTEGPIRIVAGAGSGKTRVLAARFAYLVNELGVLPSSILCATFTNKSANEMRQRIHKLTGDNDTGYISTFHSFCNTVLLEESNAFNFPKSFMVIDNADIDSFLKVIYDENQLTLRDMTFARARDLNEIQKIYKKPDYYKQLISLSNEELYEIYQKARDPEDIIFYGVLWQQKKNFALDYNDLIILTLHVFDENPKIAQKWCERLEYIMVDEFQDIDFLQYRLMKVLCSWHKNIFVVGDPDQTIYSWRGADVRYLMDFQEDFPQAKTYFLNENYRSTPQILQAANSLISKNRTRIEKNLVAVSDSGMPVHAMHFKSTEAESRGVAETIKHLVHKGYRYGDIAILYRAHYLSRPLEDVFREEEIPYTIYSGISFYERQEIKDILAYLRMLVYRSDLDFERTVNNPRRNIGKSRMKWLQEEAAMSGKTLFETMRDRLDDDHFARTKAKQYVSLIENYQWEYKPISQVITEILSLSGYEHMLRLQGSQERLDNLAEFKQAAAEYEMSAGEDVDLEHFLTHASLCGSADQQMSADKVKLMTIHTAKGLEFDAVIMVGMSEGIFPSRKTKSLSAMEEERRLAFVAMTRAKRELYLSEAEGRLLNGSLRYPSRFLLDIGRQNLYWNPEAPEDLLRQTHLAAASESLPDAATCQYHEGDRVVHKVFGEGTILQVQDQGYLIHFDKLETDRKLSFRVKLERKEEEGTPSTLN